MQVLTCLDQVERVLGVGFRRSYRKSDFGRQLALRCTKLLRRVGGGTEAISRGWSWADFIYGREIGTVWDVIRTSAPRH